MKIPRILFRLKINIYILEKEFVQRSKDFNSLQLKQKNHHYLKHILYIYIYIYRKKLLKFQTYKVRFFFFF